MPSVSPVSERTPSFCLRTLSEPSVPDVGLLSPRRIKSAPGGSAAAGKKRAREEDATKKESDTEEEQEKMEGVKEPETPAVEEPAEDAKTQPVEETVEDAKTPAVEEPVEDAKTPAVEEPVEDAKGATNKSDSVPNSQEEPAESQAY